MNNKLKLHEAIAVVLLNKPDYSATGEEIANEINLRNLYSRKDKKQVPAYQIMQRTKLSSGKYHHLFKYESAEKITLRICND